MATSNNWETDNWNNENTKTKIPTSTSLFGNDFNFGVFKSPNVAMSFKGMAVKNIEGKFCVYEDGQITDVSAFILQGMEQMIWSMPVSISKIKTGDTILHTGKVMTIIEVQDNTLQAIDISTSELKIILPIKSPFGFNFCTKITSMMDGIANKGNASSDNPFGDPMMMMMMMSNGNGGNDMNSLMPLMMMKGMTDREEKDKDGNPIKSDGKEMIKMMMMTSMFGQGNQQSNPMQNMMMMAMLGGDGSDFFSF